MKTNIQFSVEHSFFRDLIQSWVEWECPFLPRIGEHVNGWIWIDEKETNRDAIAPFLTAEGEESLRCWDGLLSDWLYEVSMETGNVKSVYYFRDVADPDKIAVHIRLGE